MPHNHLCCYITQSISHSICWGHVTVNRQPWFTVMNDYCDHMWSMQEFSSQKWRKTMHKACYYKYIVIRVKKKKKNPFGLSGYWLTSRTTECGSTVHTFAVTILQFWCWTDIIWKKYAQCACFCPTVIIYQISRYKISWKWYKDYVIKKCKLSWDWYIIPNHMYALLRKFEPETGHDEGLHFSSQCPDLLTFFSIWCDDKMLNWC